MQGGSLRAFVFQRSRINRAIDTRLPAWASTTVVYAQVSKASVDPTREGMPGIYFPPEICLRDFAK